jgi:hypothetical protein
MTSLKPFSAKRNKNQILGYGFYKGFFHGNETIDGIPIDPLIGSSPCPPGVLGLMRQVLLGLEGAGEVGQGSPRK